MRKRIQGTEHEYTLYCQQMIALGLDPHVLSLETLRNSNLHSASEFAVNQSRAYLDVGHLEFSTCEVSNFYDLLVWEKADEKIVDWLRKTVEEKYCTGKVKIWAYKNNTSPDGTAYGSHENYCISRKVAFPDKFVNELVPHLVTRFIYTGAGDILDGKYVLSPSAYKTGKIISSDTMHDTGILNTRDEPHADETKYRRLHLQIGDALLNENAILLRNFVTSAVLQLMEDNVLFDVPRLVHPLEDMWHNVEVTNPEKWKIELEDGKTISPIDIQLYYLSKIESIIESNLEKKAFKMLEEILDDLKSKEGRKLAHKIEWLDRYYAIQELSDGEDISSSKAMKICKRYSEIGEERSIFYSRRRKGLIDILTNEREIINAIKRPPDDTRAYARKSICDRNDVVELDWSHAIVSVNGIIMKYELENPFSNQIPEREVA